MFIATASLIKSPSSVGAEQCTQKPNDWRHFAPTELRNGSEPQIYKYFVATGLFKKVTLDLTAISEKSAADSLAYCGCLLYFSPASIAKGRRFCRGGSGQVANFVKAQGGL